MELGIWGLIFAHPMRFFHPEVLWGMLSIAVPIIVHLFNFRKFRKVAFSNVAFLKEIRQETHKTRNLKHLLILLARILALTCLVFAFARPYFPSNEGETAGSSTVSVYLDNSRSMEARGSEGVLLELAKNRAITLAESFASTDRFQLLTSDFEGKHQRLVSREEFIQRVQEVQPSTSSRPLSEAARRQIDLISRNSNKARFVFQITDLQKSTSDPTAMPRDTSIKCAILPQAGEIISNIFIDSVWFETPIHTLSRTDELHVRLYNTGSEERKDVPIRWIVNDVARSVGTITIGANSSSETILSSSFTDAGEKICRIEIDDTGILTDDQYFFNYEVLKIIPVLEIRGKNCSSNAVSAVFGEDDYFSYSLMSENQIDYGRLDNFRLIILHQPQNLPNGIQGAISQFIENGGTVILIPSHETEISSLNQFMSTLLSGGVQPFSNTHNIVQYLNQDHPLVRDAFERSNERADLPEVEGYFPSIPGNNTQIIASLATGEAFIALTPFGRGNFYFIASPDDAEYSSFVRHALFPALMVRMAESSAPDYPLAYELKNGLNITFNNFRQGIDRITLRHSSNGAEFLPEIRKQGLDIQIGISSEMTIPGNYQVLSQDSILQHISLNPPTRESDNRIWPSEQFNSKLDSLGNDTWEILTGDTDAITRSLQSAQSSSSSMWYMLIIWALIFLATEVLLLKFWR